jgi:hypothetical protein
MCSIVKTQEATTNTTLHELNDEWCLWAHLPHDIDWSLKSYKNIYDFMTVEDVNLIINYLPPKLVKNCMLFIMRKGITPLWEDESNRKGGCFSYKISNKDVYDCWKNLSYRLMGESLSNNKKLQQNINGITISPKKNFCVIKIWMKTCDYQDAKLIISECGLEPHGCLFKKHAPEY